MSDPIFDEKLPRQLDMSHKKPRDENMKRLRKIIKTLWRKFKCKKIKK